MIMLVLTVFLSFKDGEGLFNTLQNNGRSQYSRSGLNTLLHSIPVPK
ncbi:hypothetical protein NX029_11670 [Cytobacillus firmus]|nr:hypothetical protein [Cytobacillus firmus]